MASHWSFLSMKKSAKADVHFMLCVLDVLHDHLVTHLLLDVLHDHLIKHLLLPILDVLHEL